MQMLRFGSLHTTHAILCSPHAATTKPAQARSQAQPGGAGWWSSDASHYFHTVTYHLDLVAALQSRGLGAAAAEALLESRPLFCFTAEAMALRDTEVRLQVCRTVYSSFGRHLLRHHSLIPVTVYHLPQVWLF